MRISKALLALTAVAGLFVAIGCSDAATASDTQTGISHKGKSAPASAPAESAPASAGSAASAPA